MSVNEPLYTFARAFADQGTKNIIPDSNNEASGLASLINGFPAITQVKPEMGGIPPQRADFNGILYMLSAFCLWAQSGGQYTYKNNLQYNINCMVLHNNVFYVCLKENGPDTTAGIKEPGTDGATWQTLLEFIGSLSKDQITDIVDEAVDDAKKTLISSQIKCGMTNLTFTASAAAASISVFAVSNFNQNADLIGSQSGSNTVTVKVNGNTIGTLSMSWSTTKTGTKGHYWGNTKSSAAANTWAYSIAQGATIELTSSGGTKFNSCALQVTLGN